jgi:hypothetical protein
MAGEVAREAESVRLPAAVAASTNPLTIAMSTVSSSHDRQ